MRNATVVPVALLPCILALSAGAEETDASDLAKKTQNPVSDLVSLPFQYNIEFGLGPRDKDRHILNIQPVVPVALNDRWNLISRTILPITSAPGFAPGEDRNTGLGDLSYTAFFSPSGDSSFIWGVGPVLIIPTATDTALGTDKWSIGPSAVALGTRGPWVVGGLISNVWSFAGDDDRADVSLMLLQPFVNYNMQGGWYITSSPVMTANWEAPDGEEWTIPLGGGFGRVFRAGDRPMNFSVQAFGYADTPAGGPDWAMRFQLQFLFPK
ncbi:MAG: neuromedin U [Planctomycetota bacterium]